MGGTNWLLLYMTYGTWDPFISTYAKSESMSKGM